MSFCSFLSRTDVKNTMVRRSLQTPDDKSHITDTNLSVTVEDVCSYIHMLLYIYIFFFIRMLVHTNCNFEVVARSRQDRLLDLFLFWSTQLQCRYSPGANHISSIND